MFSLRSYFQVLNLEASNKNLLEIYRYLLEKPESEELSYVRQAIPQKIILREEIQQQLRRCVEENFISKRSRLISKVCSYTFPTIVKAKYTTEKISHTITWEYCMNCEVENIRYYYKILFDQRHSREVTNLLLDQKARVETCLIEARN